MAANSRHFDTIVIGAGISGLACAARLFQHRARAGSVLVVEARDRIGGRIGSVYVDGNRLDTGANWIHGVGTDEYPNPLMNILPHKRYKKLSGMVAFRPQDESGDKQTELAMHNASSDGWEDVSKDVRAEPVTFKDDLVIPTESAEIVQGAMWETIESVHEVAATTKPAKARDTSVLSVLRNSEVLLQAFKEVPSAFHNALGGMMQFMEPMEAAPLAAQSAEHDRDIPGMGLLEFAIADFEGDQVFLQDGYIAIVSEVAKDLVEAGAIQTNTEVTQIDWSGGHISVNTATGDVFTANNVVCTLPLGILQHRQLNAPSLFVPELPQEKTQAIAALGFGTLDKIFMVYANAWWTEAPFKSVIKRGLTKSPFSEDTISTGEHDQFEEPDSFAGFTNELPGIQLHEDGKVSAGPRLLSMTNLHSLSGFPVLCAFVSCANATYVESLSDARAADIAHRSLTMWFGREPPRPEKVHVTRWATDPHSRGSYSHMITGLSETRHREVFQQSVTTSKGAVLRFAGEHTSRNHFATVHGALLSGWREANHILERRNEQLYR